MDLFSDAAEISFEMPDFQTACKGREQVAAYFSERQKGVCADKIVRNLQLCHTPAVRVESDCKARGSFMVTAFDIQKADQAYTTEQWEARYDADFVFEDGRWKYQNLKFYILMSLYPEAYLPEMKTDLFARGIEPELPPEYEGRTNPKDYIVLQKLLGRWCQNRRINAMESFAAYEAVSFKLPTFFENTFTGRDAVGKALERLDDLERLNQEFYLSIPMIMSQVIEVAADGRTAKGYWLGICLDTKGPAFGENTKDAPVKTSIGRFKLNFIKELGSWKIKDFEFEVYATLKPTHIQYENSDRGMLRFSGDNWMYAPEATGNHSEQDIEDILELEQYIAFWAGGLRYRSEAPFYETRFAKECPELLSYATGASQNPEKYRFECSTGLQEVTQKIFEMVNKFNTLQPKSPGNHIGTTPIIEITDDGMHAYATWFDYGWTTMAEVFGLKEPPFAANPAIARYEHRYIKIDGVWKLYGFKWTPFFRIEKWQFDYENSKGWTHTTSCRRFPLPLDEYIYEDDPSKRGEKVVLEPPCIISPYEQPWTGELDKMR